MNYGHTLKSPSILRLAAALALGGGAGAALASTALPAEIVGEVTTIIGVSSVKSESGHGVELQRGAPVRAGDRIETAAGGHVHIRFIDGGLVSVRPMSRLHIESYRNAGTWGPASIKFTLEVGVMRSVTGQWGEMARDRFRLNTPVAAIGVKGTDFIVKATQGSTYATVVSGAIVMSALEGDCAVSLGPCQGGRSATLSADMLGKMLEIGMQPGTAPRLVPAVDLLAKVERPVFVADGRHAEKAGGMVGAPDAVGSNEKSSNTLIAKDVSEAIGASEIKSNALIAKEEAIVAKSKPLVWLHNIFDWNVPENSISKRFDVAAADGRQAVTGNFFITLYRDESAPFRPVGTNVNFRLTDASATFSPSSAAVGQAVQISNASLNVDFSKSTFNTSMNLASPSLGQDTFAASGTIGNTGLIASNTANQTLYGAFSNDGRQAGYGFEKTTAAGKVSGITLWGR